MTEADIRAALAPHLDAYLALDPELGARGIFEDVQPIDDGLEKTFSSLPPEREVLSATRRVLEPFRDALEARFGPCRGPRKILGFHPFGLWTMLQICLKDLAYRVASAEAGPAGPCDCAVLVNLGSDRQPRSDRLKETGVDEDPMTYTRERFFVCGHCERSWRCHENEGPWGPPSAHWEPCEPRPPR